MTQHLDQNHLLPLQIIQELSTELHSVIDHFQTNLTILIKTIDPNNIAYSSFIKTSHKTLLGIINESMYSTIYLLKQKTEEELNKCALQSKIPLSALDLLTQPGFAPQTSLLQSSLHSRLQGGNIENFATSGSPAPEINYFIPPQGYKTPSKLGLPLPVLRFPFGTALSITADKKIKINDSQGQEIFLDSFQIPRVGTKTGKSNFPIRISKDNQKAIFFNKENSVCLLDWSSGELQSEYFEDDKHLLVDLAIDDLEGRIIILNQAGTLYYKNFDLSHVSEDSSLAKEGEVSARALSLYPDGNCLILGYEKYAQDSYEDHISLYTKNQNSSFFEPLCYNFVSSHTGNLFLIRNGNR